MATFAVNSQERNSNIEYMNEIIENCVKKIQEIDAAILQLVEGGLKGSGINTMSATYLQNRQVISDYLKVFAKYSLELQEQEEKLESLNALAEGAAKSIK